MALTRTPPACPGEFVRVPAASVAAGCAFAGVAVLWWVNRVPLGMDSAVYRAGALAAVHAEPLYEPLRTAPQWPQLPFVYPPVAAILFVPLAALPVQLVWGLMAVLSAAALGVAIRTVVRHLRPQWMSRGLLVNGLVLFAFALQPVWGTIGFGQVNLVLMALVVLDTLALRGSRWCGALTGAAAAIKLTPLVFLIHLAVVGRRADAARALGMFALLQGVGIVVLPADSARYWTTALFTWHQPWVSLASNQSVNGLLQRVTAEAPYALWLSVALAAPCLALALWLARRLDAAGRPLAALLASALGGLLVSPVSWSHHWVWAVPLCLLLLDRAVDAGTGAWARPCLASVVAVFSGAGFLAVPSGDHRELAWGLTDTVLGNSYVWGALAIGLGTCWALLVARRPAKPSG